jgi:hypothetical protein
MWFCEVADFSKHIPGAEKIQLRVRDGERKIAGRKGLIPSNPNPEPVQSTVEGSNIQNKLDGILQGKFLR